MAKPLSPLHEAFGRAIRQLRDQRGLSQESLGQRTGLHRNYVGGVERGELNPTLTSIDKLAGGLNCRAADLLALADQLRPKRRRGAARS